MSIPYKQPQQSTLIMEHCEERFQEANPLFRVPSLDSIYLGKKPFEILHACERISNLLKSFRCQTQTARDTSMELSEHSDDVKRLYTNLLEDLDAKQNEISRTMSMTTNSIALEEKWWENVNIFEPRIKTDTITKLFRQNRPKDLEYAKYIRKNMYILHCCKITSKDLENFFEKLVEEIDRVGGMPITGGRKVAVDLYLEVKFHLLREQDALGFGDDYFVHYHDKVDHWLSTMLQFGRSATYCFHDNDYVDAAKACRAIRQIMHSKPCSAQKDACIFNTLIPTLHTLQQQAYEETRYKVYAAVGTIFAPELVDMIFQQAMLAEEMPLDPRIFVNARNTTNGVRARKSRLVCPHVQQKNPQIQFFRLDQVRPMLAIGPDWIELRPRYPHYDVQARQREDRKYFWFAFGYWQFGNEPERAD